jgi:hypothetical protein
MYIFVNKIIVDENSIVYQGQHSFYKQVLELITIAFFSGLIQAPLYYDSWVLHLPIELFYIERLQLLFSTLTNTLIIVYTAIAYYGDKAATFIKKVEKV